VEASRFLLFIEETSLDLPGLMNLTPPNSLELISSTILLSNNRSMSDRNHREILHRKPHPQAEL
jgi:hypothetical protein